MAISNVSNIFCKKPDVKFTIIYKLKDSTNHFFWPRKQTFEITHFLFVVSIFEILSMKCFNSFVIP